MSTIFSGSLRPYPGASPAWSAAQTARAERILDTVRRAVAGSDVEIIADEHGDYEDFWEDACRIAAAWDASAGDLVIAPRKTSWSETELASRLGPVTTAEEGGHHARDRELLHPVFRKYAGRELTLLTIDSEGEGYDPADLDTWMAAKAAAGVREVVLKNAERKGGVWKLPASTDPVANHRAVFDTLDWTAVRLAGLQDALLGQPALEIWYEYRCFVVDGKVVSGAGCVEEFTPLDAIPGERFDTRIRQHRGHLGGQPSEVISDAETVAYLLEFAGAVARDHGGTVVIDVAIDAEKRTPLVVELNGLPNSGLYASDPWAVAEALIAAKDRGY